jgi:hypothetical protein
MEKETDLELKKKSVEVFIVLIIIVVLVTGIIFYARSTIRETLTITTIECISSKSHLYISDRCSHCQQQESILGDNLKLFNITDCLNEIELCSELNILQVPTWIIGNQSYTGVKSLDELKDYTKC